MASLQPPRFSQIAIPLAAVVLLVIFAVAFQTVRSFRAASDSVQLNQNLRFLFAETAGHLKDMNAAGRAFINTADERALAGWPNSILEFERSMDKIRVLVTNDPELFKGVTRYGELVKQLIAEFEALFQVRRTQGLAAVTSRVATGDAKRLGDELRGVGTALQERVMENVKGPLKIVHQDTTRTLAILATGGALTLLLVFAAIRVLRRDYRLRAEAATVLQRQADEIKDLYNRAPCGYHSIDTEARFVSINDTELVWLGYARGEVVGKLSLPDVLTPESAAKWRPVFEQVKAGGALIDLEVDLRRHDGTTFPALLNGSSIIDAAGNFVATRVTVFDLTQRKRIEQIGEQARVFAENIFDTLRQPVVVLSQELKVVTANRAYYETFGVQRADVIGRPLAEVGGGVWHIPELFSALGTIVPEHTDLKDFEVAREFPGLGQKVMLLNARKLYRIGNGTTMMLLAIEDITERKHAEKRLQELNTSLQSRGLELEAANRELEAFSYSVSHDLRAPLRHIEYFSSSLPKVVPPEAIDAKAQRYLQAIATSARTMGQLIDDLLSFARISRTEIRRMPVRLNDIVAEARQSLQTEINGRNIAWEVAPLPEISGDVSLVRQVFANLLSNAVKYTRKHPEARIEIGVEPGAEGEVVVFVRDNGAGFDMKYADKLFGVFQRLHAASEFEGTGVGLANVRRIVERHGGRIWAQAEVDKGATFFLTLPAVPRPASPALS